MTGWQWLRLSEFCSTAAGGTPSRAKMGEYYSGGTIPWVKSGELRENVIVSSEEQITKVALTKTRLKLAPKGAILLAMYGATVGRLALLGVPAATNQAVCQIVPDPGVAEVPYLLHVLKSRVRSIVASGVGGAQPNISQGIVKNLLLPVPPLAEQRRIADVLDRADALRSQRRAAIAELDTLTQAIFLDMFGDPVTNPKGWAEKMLLGGAADIVSGVTKGRSPAGKPTRAVPYLAVSNVQDRALDLTTVKTLEATESEIQRYKLEPFDLMLTEGGDPDKLGRGTLWAGELPECIHQNHIFRVRLTSCELTPLFLSWLVGGPRGKRYFLQAAKQTTGIASINMKQLRSFPLFVPPLELQQNFARRVDEVEKLKAAQRSSLAELDALFATLQHRAFRGEL